MSDGKISEVMEIGGDFVATTLADALEAAFQDVPPRPASASRQRERLRPQKPQLRPVG